MLVVGVDLSQLFLSKTSSIERMLSVKVLMGNDHRRMSVRVSRSFEVVNSLVLALLIIVVREVEAALSLSDIL